jgi:DNA-binding HxlR family transcriptional regulator
MKSIQPRSDCPISYTLDILGDKWMLLILRDMIFEKKESYKEFMQSEEGIATNVLADRLSLLESEKFITKKVSPANKKSFVYRLTDKGITLIPLIMEITLWGSAFNPKGGNKELLKKLKKDKEGVVAEFTTKMKERAFKTSAKV